MRLRSHLNPRGPIPGTVRVLVQLSDGEIRVSRAGDNPIGTAEARKQLPDLVRSAARPATAADLPSNRAVEIQTRGEARSASLVPTIDIDAADHRIDELEDQLENAGIALFLHERLEATAGDLISAQTFLESIGMDEFLDELPQG